MQQTQTQFTWSWSWRTFTFLLSDCICFLLSIYIYPIPFLHSVPVSSQSVCHFRNQPSISTFLHFNFLSLHSPPLFAPAADCSKAHKNPFHHRMQILAVVGLPWAPIKCRMRVQQHPGRRWMNMLASRWRLANNIEFRIKLGVVKLDPGFFSF